MVLEAFILAAFSVNVKYGPLKNASKYGYLALKLYAVGKFYGLDGLR